MDVNTTETSEEFFARLDTVIEAYERLMKAKRGDYVQRPTPKPETGVVIQGPWKQKH